MEFQLRITNNKCPAFNKLISRPTEIIIGRAKPYSDKIVTEFTQSQLKLFVPDLGLCKRHCLLSFGRHEVQIRDLTSASGTSDNGVQVRNKKLKWSDVIRIGQFTSVQIAPHVKLEETEYEDLF